MQLFFCLFVVGESICAIVKALLLFKNSVCILTKVAEWNFWASLNWTQIVISIVVGIFTGWISSTIVSAHYRRKEELREARVFFRNLKIIINELAYQLIAFNLEVTHSSPEDFNFDQSFETIRRIFNQELYFDKTMNRLDEVRRFYPKFKTLRENLRQPLNIYYQSMTVLSALEGKHIGPSEKDREIEKLKQYKAAQQIGAYGGLFTILKAEISDFHSDVSIKS